MQFSPYRKPIAIFVEPLLVADMQLLFCVVGANERRLLASRAVERPTLIVEPLACCHTLQSVISRVESIHCVHILFDTKIDNRLAVNA